MNQSLEWIESNGGPLLFAPKSALPKWCGNRQSISGSTTDYQRACSVKDEIDVISIGLSQALVLGGEPDRSYLVAR